LAIRGIVIAMSIETILLFESGNSVRIEMILGIATGIDRDKFDVVEKGGNEGK
jgi:hypothetical protein